MRKTPTIALDIGNVCVKLHFERTFHAFGLSPDAVLPQEVLDSFCDLECGRCNETEWLSVFRRALENRFTETEIINNWNLILGEPMPGMEEQVRKYVGLGVKFVYLSDISPLHLDCICRYLPFAHLVSDGIYSFDAGARKPDSAMYELFEKRHGVPDFYFDDKPCNIEAARKRGWNSILFTHAEQLDCIGELL